MEKQKDYIVPVKLEFYAKVKGDTKVHAEKSFAKCIMRHKSDIEGYIKKLYDGDLEVSKNGSG